MQGFRDVIGEVFEFIPVAFVALIAYQQMIKLAYSIGNPVFFVELITQQALPPGRMSFTRNLGFDDLEDAMRVATSDATLLLRSPRKRFYFCATGGGF
jgi:hypothetical protein